MASAKPDKRTPRLSVIIVNYNVKDFLAQALTSIRKAARGIRHETIVVDNASTDGSVAMLREKYPHVRVIALQRNVGFARANNAALTKARGEFLLLINPDTVMQENSLSAMLDFFEKHPEAGIAGCKVLNPDGTFQLSCRRGFPTPWVAFTKLAGLSSLFPSTRLFGRYNLTYLDPERTYEIDALSGAFMMARRKAYEQVGGLDERFFMYGEDIDWCYRFQQSGWKVYYAPVTSIIHFKGESTRRSSIDEVRMFYEAMHLFVKKHFRRSIFFMAFLRVGISVSATLASWKRVLWPLRIALIDILLVNLSLLVAEYVWLGSLWSLPSYSYPIVFIVPALVTVGILYSLGVYTDQKHSVLRTFGSVVSAFVVIASLVAFFKSYAFSRAALAISGVLSGVLLPGWRLAYRMLFKSASRERGTLFSKRTLIVGTNKAARTVLGKVRTRVGKGYHVLGFLDPTGKVIGSVIDGVPVVGSADNIGKVVREMKITDVIFPAQTISYSGILTFISNTRSDEVNFHMVPGSMDMLIGKASVDSLDDLPLVQISYNIDKPLNRLTKRLMDVVVSLLLPFILLPLFPIVGVRNRERFGYFLRSLPSVLKGTKSLVGPAAMQAEEGAPFLGKPGVTGIVQIHGPELLSKTEREHYHIYYARNQSLGLDFELLFKGLFQQSTNDSR